jgi:hypothetical protein
MVAPMRTTSIGAFVVAGRRKSAAFAINVSPRLPRELALARFTY